MAYVVLARRFRPKNFDQIIGQEHISRTLKNAIAENRVAHAYIFSGPRGVGKTTTARILAKALNCKEGPTSEPCDTCSNCQEVTAGSSVDVQEIDGASNRGIDEIRSLRENVKFAPATSKYKIYIIDEAHQITDAAFNALLKTLEEPPDHVVFILATTESQKIPITILSRCQRYRFRLLSHKEIMSSLEKIVHTEGFQIDEAALKTIATSSGGSLRDALSLLDQAVSSVSGKVTFKDMQNLLGFLPQDIIHTVTAAMSRHDNAALLAAVKEVAEQGYSLLQFARDIREHLRYILLLQVNPAVLEIADEEKKALEQQKSLFTPAWLIRSGHVLSRALDEMRWSEQPRLVLELYLLRLAQPYADVGELIRRIEAIETNVEPDTTEYISKPAAPPKAEKAPAKEKAAVPKPQQNTVSESAPSAPPDNVYSADHAVLWRNVIAAFQKERPSMGNILNDTAIKGVTGRQLVIACSSKFVMDGIKRSQELIENIVAEKFQNRFVLQLVVEERKAAMAVPEEIIVEEEAAPAPAGEVFQVEADLSTPENTLPHGVDKILNKFPGKITKKKS